MDVCGGRREGAGPIRRSTHAGVRHGTSRCRTLARRDGSHYQERPVALSAAPLAAVGRGNGQLSLMSSSDDGRLFGSRRCRPCTGAGRGSVRRLVGTRVAGYLSTIRADGQPTTTRELAETRACYVKKVLSPATDVGPGGLHLTAQGPGACGERAAPGSRHSRAPAHRGGGPASGRGARRLWGRFHREAPSRIGLRGPAARSGRLGTAEHEEEYGPWLGYSRWRCPH